MIAEASPVWQYLSAGQRALVREGYFLVEDIKTHQFTHPISDYSFLVFPFAKAYEGYLKQLFLDLGLIRRWQYESDHLRIGKILSPNLQKMLRGRSVYRQLIVLTGSAKLPDLFWAVWKRGRNQLFHYYPHNLSAISLLEAEAIITDIIYAMEQGVITLQGFKRRVKKPVFARPV